jgi:hypothetical protein
MIIALPGLRKNNFLYYTIAIKEENRLKPFKWSTEKPCCFEKNSLPDRRRSAT